jgi:penicillin-binding protein 1A
MKPEIDSKTYNLKIEASSGRGASPAMFWQAVFREFYKTKKLPSGTLPEIPTGIITAPIDIISGKRPTDYSYSDPRGSTVRNEYFIQNTYPTEDDDMHVPVSVCSVSGMLPTSYCPVHSRVMLVKDPARLYQSGVVPYSALGTQAELAIMAPTQTCTLHSPFSSIIGLPGINPNPEVPYDDDDSDVYEVEEDYSGSNENNENDTNSTNPYDARRNFYLD